MPLSFPQLLSFLLAGLGIAVIISAIRPAATVIGVVLLSLGVLGLFVTLFLRRGRS